MQNATEFKPEDGAYARVAQRLGKHRQQIWKAYKSGNKAIMAAVFEASSEIKEENKANMKRYLAALKRHQALAGEINKLTAEAAQQ